MSGTKNSKRGRPKRNNITALQQHQVNEASQSSNVFQSLDIHQPLTIVKLDTLLHENSDSCAVPGVELSRLPKVHYERRDQVQQESDEEDYIAEQNYQQQHLLSLHAHPNQLDQPYQRPENHFIHYIEPSDDALYDSVEYDMDEQDKEWLQLYNTERRKESPGEISPYLFECIMDKLEKEWFLLIKNAPKLDTEQVILPEDSACAVCDDTEVENSNAIVFCDGCNVAVHQDCYGIPYIPEGQWLCRKCMISPEFPVSCIFCPNEGGAFKQTNTNQWGHLLCAIWIPEVGVSNTIYMEPIDMIGNVPKSRWKLTCFICRKREGACIQCDNKHCFSAFHVTCAKTANLCMKMNSHTSQSEGVILKAYCDKHTPKEHVLEKAFTPPVIEPVSRGRGGGRGRGASSLGRKQQQQQDFNDVANNKVARAHQHHYSTGAPIAPDTILAKIDDLVCVKNSGIRKRPQMVTAIAHYWSLKRESRRGAPLLKRLHLEPWTASSKYNRGESDLLLRQSVVTQLRDDLEKVRLLTEQVHKRERQKLSRTKEQKTYIEMILFPLEYVIRPILAQFMTVDKKKYFLNHVTEEEAPDYKSVIAHSMCFSEIYQKMTSHQYTELDQFINDVSLIWENGMDYNEVDTSYYRVATSLKKASKKLFESARQHMTRFKLKGGMWDEPFDPAIFDYLRQEDEGEKPIKKRAISKDKQIIPTTQTINQVHEHFIQSLTISNDQTSPKQKSISNYFAEQHLLEQQRKEKREQNRLLEEAKALQVEKELKPPTQQSFNPPVISNPLKQPTKPTKSTVKREEGVHTRTISGPSRLTRSAGLQASIQELTKRPKISQEARALFASYNGVSHLDKPLEVYKENRKKSAPVGWVYVDEEEEEEEGRNTSDEETPRPSKYAKRKRNDIPIPNFKRGEIVWARVTGYPSHPAKFMNLLDEETSPKILASRRFKGDVLVEFLQVPENHKWGWVERSCICEVGDPLVDRSRLSESLGKKYRMKPYIVQEAKEGYRNAGSILGLDPEPLLSAVFDKDSKPKRKKKAIKR